MTTTEPESTDESAPVNFHAMWDYNDPAESETQFRAMLAEAQAQASGDHALQAEILTQIARTQGLQREFDDAHATLDQTATMIGDSDAAPMVLARARVRYLLERGRVLNSSKHPDAARPLFVEAWDTARAASIDGLAVDAAHMIALVEPPASPESPGPPEQALEWNQRALDLAESSDDPDAQRWKGSLCNNIGWTYHRNSDYQTALRYFDRQLEYRREQGKVDDIRVARWCIARCLRSLDQVVDALAIQRELEVENESSDKPDGYVYEEIAECLLALGRADEAKPYFAKAHQELSKDAWLVDNEAERIERLAERGGVIR